MFKVLIVTLAFFASGHSITPLHKPLPVKHPVVHVHKPKPKPKPAGPVLGEHYVVTSTCYDQGTTTASGAHVFVGEVANNMFPLGTRIYLDRAVFGLREFIVDDRIGWGSQLDFYNPSATVCDEYGREGIGFRIVLKQ
jgi:3D (Asp-Asp-Asp) domain-containing protein